MKRGFMKTPRYKRGLNSPAGKPREKVHRVPDGVDGEQAAADQGSNHDAMDVEMTKVEEVYADGRVVAVRVTKKAGVPDDSNDDKKNSKAKGKGKAKMEGDDTDAGDPNMGFVPPRPSPGRVGWGRTPAEDFFHTVPESHGGPYKKRGVFRLWPRDPNGIPLVLSNKYKGTLSPDGYPWAATLYDLFNVNKLPHVGGMVSIMTGSALCQQVVALGELHVAAPEIEWAKSEGRPRVVGVADTEELITCSNMRIGLLPFIGFQNAGADGMEEDEEADADTGAIHTSTPLEIPVTSHFHPSHYPKGWPSVPFKHPLSILLQERIPLHLLPQTLYVHDPFCLLSAREQSFHNTSWTSRPDAIRTYNLHLSDAVRSRVEEARRKAEELEEFKARTLVILRYTRMREQIKNHDPIIEIPLPPYPRRTTKTGESHLYISPAAMVGQGHHSVVYKAEWELPRNIFMKDRICRLCLKESADMEIQRLKNSGRWEKMLRAASWGPSGFTGRKPTKEELDAVNDVPKLNNDEVIIEREITCIVPPDVDPSQILDVLDKKNIWESFMEQRAHNTMQLCFAQEGVENEATDGSYVAGMRINPQFGYRKQGYCDHMEPAGCSPIPRTAKFTVVAKLSFEHDPHLAREARNYQEFPERFFHHYDGYTIISQLHSVVPVNAIVPQFFGYYKPSEKQVGNHARPRYLSPILLLEHCGEPIEPEEISVEDQEECASMLLRFQRSGWLHESVAPRNFLVQYGKPTEFPLTRQCKPEPSYRLIDFGRSRKYQRVQEKQEEEGETLRMFQKLCGMMGYTLRM